MCIYTVLPYVSSPARPAVSCPDISGWHIGDAASFNLFIWEAVHRTASQRHSDWESAGRDRFSSDLGMSASGRQPPIIILSRDRPLLGESGHSSKELICSVRPRLNDRFRLLAALQLFEKLSPRSAATGPKADIRTKTFCYVLGQVFGR